ncbi:MAG: 3-dehydroquinate synthase [Ruminococcaceae bacterium]|nr:3-dehydroquinate synthase [Oscillospiraceae bacterium]
MKTVHVKASLEYDVIIGKGLLCRTGELTRKALGVCSLCIVTDDTVDSLYGEKVENSLRESGFSTVKFVIPHGEASKSTASLVALLEFLAENKLTRGDAIVALGGGVVGDLAGFAAAVYLRGIKFIQIPTTLLAAVDSSVGGKTAVDLVAGKNLAGAFHQPSLVICDYETLDTLTPEIFADGCAEVIKYGIINDKPLFTLLEKGIKENIEEIIASCVANKAAIVAEDEFDTGKRQLLNLGHTVGHAIEACSEFSISHGSAVAIGMVIVTRAAVALGLCAPSELSALTELLKAAKLPTSCSYTAEELTPAALGDKKRKGSSITLVIPYSIGDSRLYKTDVADLEEFIRKGL